MICRCPSEREEAQTKVVAHIRYTLEQFNHGRHSFGNEYKGTTEAVVASFPYESDVPTTMTLTHYYRRTQSPAHGCLI